MNDNTYFEYKQVHSSAIFSDPTYQRPIDMHRVQKIVQQFRQDLVNPAKVSRRDGKYYVFDGQHTLAALKARNGGKDLMVDCKVYKGLTREQEAELFSLQNGVSRNVQTIHRLRALYAAGDPDVKEFYNFTNLSGVRMDFTQGKAVNKIVAVAKAYKIYNSVPSKDYTEILMLIRDTWDGVADSYSQEILGGVTLFYTTYKREINRRTFINQLSKVSPKVIIREGKALSDKRSDTKYARQILDAYNRSLRNHRLENRL